MTPSLQTQIAKQEEEFAKGRKLETPLTNHCIVDSRSDGTLFGFIRVRHEGAEYLDPFRDFDWVEAFESLADNALAPTKENAMKLLGMMRAIRRKSQAATERLEESAKSFKTLETALTKINVQIHEQLSAVKSE